MEGSGDSAECVETLRAQIRAVQAERDLFKKRADWLEHRVKRLAYLLYGRKSEKLTPSELKQLAFALED